MRRALALSLLFVLALPALAEAPKVTTIILVRHAEKAGPSGDVPLSDAGKARAVELARVLTGAGVSAVYATQFARTQQTAEPLATALKVKATVAETSPTYAKDLAAAILKDHAGETVVVVSHSNTLTDVMTALGVADPPKIVDSQYDDLFVVTRVEGGPSRLVSLRYGEAAR
jgi:broad specificity phosphatase PhoE